ncbi:hypothetical protein GCM10009122_18130 [Fulvivirga kasyanovii]|uniref:HMA domain-containing protein n=1 Tax=Fulvivirga kasyanovii TaxID=396812 RepID=A0ABW9RWX4_9BACT|nr:hypothetical protein [Fulvivirga kasyanovii]MTI28762.1 hypothetical protein [Fulvivirga kasyanovii]
MVEVFKTNINDKVDAERVLVALSHHFPFATINFDLTDVDNILRIECKSYLVNFNKLISMVNEMGFEIEALGDYQPIPRFF